MRIIDKLSDHLAYPPRGMAAERAAAYVGFGTTKFLEMVEEGTMPKPNRYHRWDRLELDAAFEDLKDKERDPEEVGRKQAEQVHRARQAKRAAQERG
jgi:hypothetical protein